MKKCPCIKGPMLHFMRIGLLCMALTVSVTGALYAKAVKGQEVLKQRVSLDADQDELKQVFKQLGKEAGVKFIYVSPLVPDRQLVTFQADNEPLGLVLERLLQPLHLRMEV